MPHARRQELGWPRVFQYRDSYHQVRAVLYLGLMYEDGSTAQFSIATANGSAHPPVAGVDYDQIKLTANTPAELQIDPGTTCGAGPAAGGDSPPQGLGLI